jgi:hypothetical protein
MDQLFQIGPLRQLAFEFEKNAVRFSSALTMNRFPSPRCASAMKIVRPSESTANTQPELEPALLRLSAMISQYFILRRAWFLSVNALVELYRSFGLGEATSF